MARLIVAVACWCLLAAGTANAHAVPEAAVGTQAAAPVPSATFVLTGRGWGHGVGMSQYGALGFAQRGHGYAEILAHYYPGTELGQESVGRVRVLVAERTRGLSVGSAAPFTVRDGEGEVHDLEAGTVRFGPGLRIKLAPDRPAEPLPGPLVFSGKSAPLELGGKPYRGTFHVAADRGRLDAVNHLGLEAYLFGVVPREVPSSWPAEALKAQAVVARSYALAGRRSGGAFDLFADVRSQVYGGISAEQSATTAAVLATVGQLLLYEGKVATTYFFSTSGGRTADVAEAWAGAGPIPYLVSVPDPYDSLSPYHTWGPVSITGVRMKKALGLAAVPVAARTTLTGSGRADELVLTLADGREIAVPAATARSRLGLRSTWFRVGSLVLQRGARRITFGSRLRLSGSAAALEDVVLERRAPGQAWEQVVAPKVGEDGSFAVVVRPRATTDYRLVSGTLRGGPLRIFVAPRLRLLAPAAPTELRGTVRPVLPGAVVQLQRAGDDGKWRMVARATVDDAGAFVAEFDLVAGTYRARLARRGYAVGLSPVLEVVRE